MQTAERSSSKEKTDNVIFQRHLFAYNEAAKLINGNTLEIGSGEGYGLEVVAPKSTKYTAIDKHKTSLHLSKIPSNVSLLTMNIPPLTGIKENEFDTVITFQVIEHIKDDNLFINEIVRVLKKGGKLILTTPNIKRSLTRNPWHVREYTFEQINKLLVGKFTSVVINGITGNDKVMRYYIDNKKSVERVTRYDIFNLQYRLPRWMLKVPYDILNRMNRKKLMQQSGVATEITINDYKLIPADSTVFDFFIIAIK